MRKLAILATVAVLALAGCGKKTTDQQSAPSENTASSGKSSAENSVQSQPAEAAIDPNNSPSSQIPISDSDKKLIYKYMNCGFAHYMSAAISAEHINDSAWTTGGINNAVVGYNLNRIFAAQYMMSASALMNTISQTANKTQEEVSAVANSMNELKNEETSGNHKSLNYYNDYTGKNCIAMKDIPNDILHTEPSKIDEFATAFFKMPPRTSDPK